MSIILTADIHLTDKPEDDYRWQIFETLRELSGDKHPVYILGDLLDRKDRHSSRLVNRLVRELDFEAPCYVIMGNHDKSVNGEPYLNILNKMRTNLGYLSEPTWFWGDIMFLPYSANPAEEWKNINFGTIKCIFMHQPCSEILFMFGKKQALDLSMLPDVPIYSGDIHIPQTIRNLTYVGAPHPINFGDDYTCRVLVINENDFSIEHEVILTPPGKHTIKAASLDDLISSSVRPGDQARIRFNVAPEAVADWPLMQQQIADWAASTGVSVASVEAVVEAVPSASGIQAQSNDPRDVFHAFSVAEGLDDIRMNVGMNILSEVRE